MLKKWYNVSLRKQDSKRGEKCMREDNQTNKATCYGYRNSDEER